MSSNLKGQIIKECRKLGLPMVGFASSSSWDDPPFQPWPPEEFRPNSIFPEAKSVIVIGLPISLPIIETTPSIYYHELYNNVNLLLDQSAYKLSLFLTEKGHPSIYVPRDGYGNISILKEKPTAFFSHRHAAYLAGLGSFGINNMLLTKEYGPRVRFTSIFSTADIEPDEVVEEDLCIKCMRCVKMCPTSAIVGRAYPKGLTKKKACATYNDKLRDRFISPCGICIKVCPVGEDRKQFGREDMSIYEGGKGFDKYRKAWKHVQSYGGK